MRGGAADIESRRFKDAGIPAEIVFRSEIDVNGNTGGGTSRDQKSFGKYDFFLRVWFSPLRGEGSAQAKNSSQHGGRNGKNGGSKIQGDEIGAWFVSGLRG